MILAWIFGALVEAGFTTLIVAIIMFLVSGSVSVETLTFIFAVLSLIFSFFEVIGGINH
jgi:hypothetical protein